MAKVKTRAPESSVALFDAQISAHPTIERKGATNPYTSVNGHMYSTLNKKGDVGLRLSKENREQFLLDHSAELFVSHNTVMKEYVAIPRWMLESTKDFQKYLNMSYDYVSSLKPKPTTRKKK